MRALLLALVMLVGLFGAASAQTPAYRLQPGDTLAVTVWQDSKLDRQVVVGPDGTISFPLAGHLQASGQTLQSVEAELRKRLQANYNTQLDITVSLAATTPGQSTSTIFITGEVNKPGPYPFVPPTDILQALASSGGFSPFAATSRIEIYRRVNGRDVKMIFNYRDFQSGRDVSGNINLRAGDVVVVPEKGLFGF